MPGTNAGTGHPITARCFKCSREIFSSERRRGYRLEATGRTKNTPRSGRAYRCTDRYIEVKCLDCGYVGWTKHIDAESLLTRYLAGVS